MGDPPDLLVAPDLGGIGVLDFHRCEEMIAKGEEAIAPHLPIIERHVNSSSPSPLQTAHLFPGAA